LRFLSGRLTKLAALTNLSGTNLDAGGARRVSGMDATNQTGKSLILTKSRYSSTQKKGGVGCMKLSPIIHRNYLKTLSSLHMLGTNLRDPPWPNKGCAR